MFGDSPVMSSSREESDRFESAGSRFPMDVIFMFAGVFIYR